MKIELINQTKCNSIYKIDGTTVLIWTIVGGQIATSLTNYNQQARWNKIPHDKNGYDSPEISWIDDQVGLEVWLKSAIIKQAELDLRPRLSYKRAFKTAADEILIVNVELSGYVSITADLVAPVPESDAIEMNNSTVDGLNEEEDETDYSEYYETFEFFDNSLYYEDIEFEGLTYLFETLAGGCLHTEIQALDIQAFNDLIDLHLKGGETSFYQAVDIVRALPKHDLDENVEAIAIEILS